MFVPKNLEDLKRIVEQRLEETARLEFKRQLPEPGKNDDMAKDLAAMANTEGGVIIYGIDEDDMGRAKELRPFPVSDAGERVTLVAQNIPDEPVTLGSVRPIALEDGGTLGFLVVEVPRSDRAPHFCQGAAWGRTAKSNAPLTRRRVGELFAHSSGFAGEFGVVVGPPVVIPTGGKLLVSLAATMLAKESPEGKVAFLTQNALITGKPAETDFFGDLSKEVHDALKREAEQKSEPMRLLGGGHTIDLREVQVRAFTTPKTILSFHQLIVFAEDIVALATFTAPVRLETTQ